LETVLDHGLDDTAFGAATLTAQRPLMFTNTGLVQFKNIFDNVGYTARGHRSLKSWALSFGDYSWAPSCHHRDDTGRGWV
jgi:hypothetical protein